MFRPVEFQLSFGAHFDRLGQATGTIYSPNKPFTPRPWGAAVSVLYGNWEYIHLKQQVKSIKNTPDSRWKSGVSRSIYSPKLLGALRFSRTLRHSAVLSGRKIYASK